MGPKPPIFDLPGSINVSDINSYAWAIFINIIDIAESTYRKDDRAMPKIFSLTTPMATFPEIFHGPIDPVNMRTKFEVRSCFPSSDNRGAKNWSDHATPWIRPRSLLRQ